jgi:hypothetical protein
MLFCADLSTALEDSPNITAGIARGVFGNSKLRLKDLKPNSLMTMAGARRYTKYLSMIAEFAKAILRILHT